MGNDRYARNYGTVTEEGQKILHKKKVLVIGAGGLGGFVIEGLARMGVKTIGVCDCDVFDESNLNRQLLSNEEVIGQQKAIVARKRIHLIDKTINVTTYMDPFPNEDIAADIHYYDIVIDCLDNIQTRFTLENFCIDNNKLLIHGAVGGYYGTVAVVSPENRILSKLAQTANVEEDDDIEILETVDMRMGNPYSIVAIVASLEVHLALRVMLGKDYLKSGLYYIDIQNFYIDEIPVI